MRRSEHVLRKKMTRKEFLLGIGFGLTAILGMGAVTRLFFSKPDSATSSPAHGNAKYGG